MDIREVQKKYGFSQTSPKPTPPPSFYPWSPKVEPWVFRLTFSSSPSSPSSPSSHHQIFVSLRYRKCQFSNSYLFLLLLLLFPGVFLYCTVLYCMYCTVCTVLYVLYCMYCMYCTVCTVLYVLYCYVLYCMYCTVCTVLYVLYCMYCTVCTVLYIL